jgi:hypothetical protein
MKKTARSRPLVACRQYFFERLFGAYGLQRPDGCLLPKFPWRSRIMRFANWKFAHVFLAAVVVIAFAASRPLVAQNTPHVVSPSDLQKAAVNASQTRQQNIDALNRFFSSDQARQALQSARIDPQQVTKAIPGLSDDELAQLAARASKAQTDFAAGGLITDLVIILAIVIIVIVVVGVH